MANDERNGKVTGGYLRFVYSLAGLLMRLGIGPTALTFAGLILAVGAGVVLWSGHLVIGGILLFAGGISDSLDGALARRSGKVTYFGAILDSTFDRYAEFAVFLGFYGYLGHSHARFVGIYQLIAIIALLGSVMVSYIRARGEGGGVKCSVGFWQRPERIIALGSAAIVTGILNSVFITLSYNYLHDITLKLALLVLAVGTNFTAIRRLTFIRRSLRERGTV